MIPPRDLDINSLDLTDVAKWSDKGSVFFFLRYGNRKRLQTYTSYIQTWHQKHFFLVQIKVSDVKAFYHPTWYWTSLKLITPVLDQVIRFVLRNQFWVISFVASKTIYAQGCNLKFLVIFYGENMNLFRFSAVFQYSRMDKGTLVLRQPVFHFKLFFVNLLVLWVAELQAALSTITRTNKWK